MTNDLNTLEPEPMPLATPAEVTAEPLHAVPARWTKARTLHGLAERHVPGFRGGLPRKTVALVGAPWTLAIRLLLSTSGAAIERLPQDLLGPWQMLREVARRRDAEWRAWTPPQRLSVLRQSTLWFLVMLGVVAISAILPDALLPVPAVALIALWYSRSHWDLVRAALGMPQLPELAEEHPESVQEEIA